MSDDVIERIERLERQVEQEREKREELEHNFEITRKAVWDIEDKLNGEDDHVGLIEEDLQSQITDLRETVDKLAKGDVSARDLVKEQAGDKVEDLLPIHQMYLTVYNAESPDQHTFSENQEIAARMFPHWAEYADPSHGRLTLTSTKARQIINRKINNPKLAERLDVDDPNPNTVRRAMEFMGRCGNDILLFNTEQKRNRIIADKDAWVKYRDEVVDGTRSVDDLDVRTEPEASPTDDAGNTVEEQMKRAEAGHPDDRPHATDGGDR